MPRKTFELKEMVDNINMSLRTSTCSKDMRLGMCAVVEQTLQAAGAYGGFAYLNKNDVAEGQVPGIIINDDGTMVPYYKRFVDTDESRRYYMVKG